MGSSLSPFGFLLEVSGGRWAVLREVGTKKRDEGYER